MNHDEPNVAASTSQPRRKSLTTAGRLLADITSDGALDMDQLARRLTVPAQRLRACRDGSRALELEHQLMLAALVVELAPQHGSLARRLYAQAQSALRMRLGAVDSHLIYPGWRWRIDRA